MRRSGTARITARLIPFIVPAMAAAIMPQVDGIPDFIRGLVTGASIALLLGFCWTAGTEIGITKRGADERRLDELDPLGALPREEGDER